MSGLLTLISNLLLGFQFSSVQLHNKQETIRKQSVHKAQAWPTYPNVSAYPNIPNNL